MTEQVLINPSRSVCPWVGNDPIYLAYHDHEWGLPVHEDQHLFELLALEAMQAGLSWITILKRREAFRNAFDRFDPNIVAGYDESRILRLLADPGIIRNRRKIEAIIRNASAFLAVQDEFGSFDRYLWSLAPDGPIVGAWPTADDVPATSPLSDQLSRDLKHRGFSFVGSTICYAFLQASGVVNDHLAACDCRVAP